MTMKRLMGIINLYNHKDVLWELTRRRPLAAVPFAGRYRLIDFALSNMINSKIANVGIMMAGNYRSLMDHIRSGKEWDLARKRDGLFLLPPAAVNPGEGFQGDLHAFQSNFDYLQNSRQSHVIVSGCNMVCNVNYEEAFAFHQAKGADITVLYKPMTGMDQCPQCSMLGITEEGRVHDVEINPVRARNHNLSLEMYIMDKRLLIELVDEAVSHGGTTFVRDALMKNLSTLKVYGYAHSGYLAHLISIRSYYHHSLELLRPEVWKELFFANGMIYTKVKDEAPTKYNNSAKVSNSMIANGCILEGTVENSIIFRAVKVHKDAVIRNSIIMQKGDIGPGAVLENMICDKDVRISAGKRLMAESNYPLVITKGSVI
jgi:glucose-1-phosphate adenylyltransferase